MRVKTVVKAKKSWSQFHRDTVESVVAEAIKFYGLEDAGKELVVKLVGYDDQWGSMAIMERGKKYQIWLHGGYSTKRIISTVFHEMTHVKQAIQDGFGMAVDGETVFWKHKERKYVEDKDYWTAPWEVEARRMERKLTKRYMK